MAPSILQWLLHTSISTVHLPFMDLSFNIPTKQGCIVGVNGQTVKVIGAEPFFGVDTKKFCDSGTVYFTNYTIGNDPVVSRTWDFGDGSPTTSTVDPTHKFLQPGLYSVSQSVTTQQGCSKTIYDTIRVYRTPDPYIVGDSIGCLNETLDLRGMLTVPDTAIILEVDIGEYQFAYTEYIDSPSLRAVIIPYILRPPTCWVAAIPPRRTCLFLIYQRLQFWKIR